MWLQVFDKSNRRGSNWSEYDWVTMLNHQTRVVLAVFRVNHEHDAKEQPKQIGHHQLHCIISAKTLPLSMNGQIR